MAKELISVNPANTVKDFYETFDFEGMITDPPKLIQDFLEGEIKFIKEYIKPNKHVLEIGCGYGRLLKVLSAYSKQVTGVDFSKKMIELSKRNLSEENVKLYLMEAGKLQFPDGSFDYVLCLDNGFGNMPGIELDVLKQMKRVCKIGGEVVVSVFSEKAKEVQIENYRRVGLKNINDNGTAIYTSEGFYSRRFTKKQLRGLFSKANMNCNITSICPVNYIAIASPSK